MIYQVKKDMTTKEIHAKLVDPVFARTHKIEGTLLTSDEVWELIYTETDLVYTYDLCEDVLNEIVEKINERQWLKLSKSQTFSEEFLREYSEQLSLGHCNMSMVSQEFLIEFSNELNWAMMSLDESISLDILEEFPNNIDWRYISNRDDITEEFVIRNKDSVDWYCIKFKMNIPGFEAEKEKCEAWYKPKKKVTKEVEVTDEHRELIRNIEENERAIYQNILDGKSMKSSATDEI